MQFTTLTVMLLTLSTSLLVQGANITYRGFASTVSCVGANFHCNDAGNRCCGNFPDGWGYSAQFDRLPDGADGLGYSDVCTSETAVFKLYGSARADRCWNGGGTARAIYMQWRPYNSKMGSDDAKDEECAHPDGFTYHDDKGIERIIKIAQGNASVVHEIARLHRNGDFKALAAYHISP